MMSSCVSRLLLVWMPNFAESISRNVGKKLRPPALHAIMIHCGTKSAQIALLKHWRTHTLDFFGSPTLTHFHDSDTQMQTIEENITETYPVLIHWLVVYAILILCRSTDWFIILLSCTQQFYNAELYPIIKHCWGKPYLNTFQSNSQFQ